MLQPVTRVEEVGSKIRKLFSSMISADKKKKATATSSKSGEIDGVRGPQAAELEVEVDEGDVSVVSKKVKTENTEEVGTKKKEEGKNRKF